MLLYLMYVLGIFFSIDQSHGWKYAEYKAAMLVLPLLFSFKPVFSLKKSFPVTGFLLGMLWVIFIGLSRSWECYQENHWLFYCFSKANISPVHHPSYFSCFLLFVVAVYYYGFSDAWKGYTKGGLIVSSLVAMLLYFLCFSLAGILYLGMLIGLVGLFYLVKKKSIKWVGITIVGITLFGFFFKSQISEISSELKEGAQSYTELFVAPEKFIAERVDKETIPGNEVRLIMWKVSLELMIENPLGVGTGSVDEYLRKRLRSYGLNQMADEDYNPHNQFFQTAIEIGWFGLLVLLSLMAYGIYLSWRKRSYLLLLLFTCLAFNSLFESMFQRESGILFFTFWMVLLAQDIDQAFLPLSKHKRKLETH